MTHQRIKGHPPKREKVVFKQDKGLCNHIHYIKLHESIAGIAMVQTEAKL